MIKNKTILVFTVLALTALGQMTYAANPKIAWFWSNPDSGFWPLVERFVSAASKDLGVDIYIYPYGDNPMLVAPTVEKVLSHPETKPDAIMFHNYKNTGEEVLDLAEKYKDRFRIIDASRSIEEVKVDIFSLVASYI